MNYNNINYIGLKPNNQVNNTQKQPTIALYIKIL